MKGLGTIINVVAVLLGGSIGLFVKSGLKKQFQDILMQACGLATIFIGIGGALAGMLAFDRETGAISTQNTLLIVCSLVIGGLVGAMAIVSSVLIFCVGYNIAFGKKIRVGNLLPAILVPVISAFLPL